MTTISLTMIVRNEAHIIKELLSTIVAYIDTYTIVDTGSTDDTIKVIEDYMYERSIPGSIHTRPWVNFGHNRSEALSLARGTADYQLVMDADDLLIGTPLLNDLKHDCYYMKYGKDFTYKRVQLFKDTLSWRYEGILHEYPVCDKSFFTKGLIEGDYYIESRRLGSRNSNPNKYKDDAAVLYNALISDPDNTRYMFYLAQSYYDAGMYHEAMQAYGNRASKLGWEEEVYYSLYKQACCVEIVGSSLKQVIQTYLKAYEYRPTRGEAMHRLAKYLRQLGKYELAAFFSSQCLYLPQPKDILFVDKEVHDYKLKDEFSVAAFYSTNPLIKEHGKEVCKELCLREDIPTEVIYRAKENYKWYQSS